MKILSKSWLTISRTKVAMLLSITSLMFAGLCNANQYNDSFGGELTLPQEHKIGYRPSMAFCIEKNAATGNYQAYSANQARFNHAWMNQDRAKVGGAAKKELFKIGIKALYKALHARLGAVKNYVPNQNGQLAAKTTKDYSIDYKLRVNSDTLQLGLAMTF
ncbi:MAG: hypothetical protein ACSHWQ_04085 [Spongiibacteraceae bacterium]